MPLDLTSLIIGFSGGVLVTLSIGFPRVGKIIARCLATVLFAAGSGLLVWTIYALATSATFRPVGWNHFNIAEPSEGLGWAGGLMVGGLLALILSFARAPAQRRN